jgi:hypothetical protein
VKAEKPQKKGGIMKKEKLEKEKKLFTQWTRQHRDSLLLLSSISIDKLQSILPSLSTEELHNFQYELEIFTNRWTQEIDLPKP